MARTLGGERAAHQTGLGPGRYVFEVVAAAASAGACGKPATVTFEIEPHLWQMPWFALAVALLLPQGRPCQAGSARARRPAGSDNLASKPAGG